MKGQSDLISIIIPVYNVVGYLDRCIESIVKQPCDNFEIILVNDGSTDGSYEKCLEWQEKDKRIQVISQENKGLGPARSAGIEAASGEYLAFIDSDDWVHKDFISSITEAIQNNKADIIYFDIYKAYEQKNSVQRLRFEEINFHHLSDNPFCAADIPEVVYKSGNWTWNKIYRKSLWQDLQIRQPAHTVEDICTIFVLLIKAEKIYHLRKKLYYYFQRPDSLSYKNTFFNEYQKAVGIAEENFKFYQIDEKFRYPIGKVLGECISFTKLNFQDRNGVEQKIADMENRFRDSLFSISSFGGISAIAFGSFNLRMIIKEVMYYLPPYYGFSSIISMMDSPDCMFPIPEKTNKLRMSSLKAEFLGSVKKLLEQGSLDYVFLDLMEDRYDVIKLPGGGYLTKSEAFEEAGVVIPHDSIIIKYGSEEFISLWKEHCLMFIKLLQKAVKPEHVVLIRHRLSRYYGVNRGDWEFKDDFVDKSNEIIVQLDEYLIQNFKGIHILDTGNSELYYTDSNFTFGCYPWHLNIGYYSEMGRRLKKILEKEGLWMFSELRPIEPVFEKNDRAICYYCNDSFAPYLGVSIYSLISNSNDKTYYDILILDNHISEGNKQKLVSLSVNHDNISIRFIPIHSFLVAFRRRNMNLPNISIDTYSRFIVFSSIFNRYHKILTIDADTVVEDDIAKLLEIDLKGYPAGAVREEIMKFMLQKNLHIPKHIAGWKECPLKTYFKLLHINSTRYFNAGVLLINLEECRRRHVYQRFVNICKKKINFYYQDQDILNILFGNQYKDIPGRWNAAGYRPILLSPIYGKTGECSTEYLDSLENPGIIHYAGPLNKPWRNYGADFTDEFFYYAKHTPWFGTILSETIENRKYESENSGFFSLICPQGSKRRSFIKKSYYKLHDKWYRW